MIRGVSKTIEKEAKEEKGEFLSVLLGTIGPSLLGNLLTSKGMKDKKPRQWVIRAGRQTIRTDQDF